MIACPLIVVKPYGRCLGGVAACPYGQTPTDKASSFPTPRRSPLEAMATPSLAP